MELKKIIDGQTALTASENFFVKSKYPITIIFDAPAGIGGTEYADLQISYDNGTTWVDVFMNGTQVRLGDTNNVFTLSMPGNFRINKQITVNPASVIIVSEARLKYITD